MAINPVTFVDYWVLCMCILFGAEFLFALWYSRKSNKIILLGSN